MKGSPTYNSWINMKARCNNPNTKDYVNYGARGISVCDRWAGSFENFLDDMGERPDGTTIDRRDNNKGYNPENCRWATTKEQSINKRDSIFIELNGETRHLHEWCEMFNIAPGTAYARLIKGWDATRVFGEDVRLGRKGVAHNETLYTHNGETKNLKDWARSCGINYHTLRQRVLRYGQPLHIAISKKTRRAKKYSYKGITATTSEWAKRIGVNKSTIAKRIRTQGAVAAIEHAAMIAGVTL